MNPAFNHRLDPIYQRGGWSGASSKLTISLSPSLSLSVTLLLIHCQFLNSPPFVDPNYMPDNEPGTGDAEWIIAGCSPEGAQGREKRLASRQASYTM